MKIKMIKEFKIFRNLPIRNEGIKWYSKGKFEEGGDIPEPTYDDFITDDYFRQYLIENDAYEKYIKNCNKSFKTNFNSYKPYQWTISAFGWGPDFNWSDLHYKWIDYLRNNNRLNYDD